MYNIETNSLNESIYNLNENNIAFQIKDNLQNCLTFPSNNSGLEEEDDLFLGPSFIYTTENKSIEEKLINDYKRSLNNNKSDTSQNEKSNKVWSKPVVYDFNKIKQLFNQLQNKENSGIFVEINSILEEKKEFMNNLINELFKRKPKKIYDTFSYTDLESINFEELCELYDQKLIDNKMKPKSKKKLGRKREKDSPGKHNKMSHDNIIKKIKRIIFSNVIIFLNNILDPNKEAAPKLLNLSYKFINKLKREDELKDLNSSLKDLASKEISEKYKSKMKQLDFNKKIIDKIQNNQNDLTMKFAFNLSLKNWIDLFCHKKTVNQLLIEYKFNEQAINSERIENSLNRLNRVDILLNDIKKNVNSDEYLISFIFLLYNYEVWFYLKRGRNKIVK